jgi:hypothetical protein
MLITLPFLQSADIADAGVEGLTHFLEVRRTSYRWEWPTSTPQPTVESILMLVATGELETDPMGGEAR